MVTLRSESCDKAMGARPLARLIADKIKKPLAEEVLFGKLSKGGSVTIGVEKTASGTSPGEKADDAETALTFKYSTTKPKAKSKTAAGDGELVN